MLNTDISNSWEYLFGLKNAYFTFQRVIHNILLGIQNERCLVNMHDIIVYSPIQEHLAGFIEVFNPLRKSNLDIQDTKCEFLRKKLTYWDHLFNQKGIKRNSSKIFGDIKSPFDHAVCYRRIVWNFTKISKLLSPLIQTDTLFLFQSKCIKSFEELQP